MHVLMLNKFYYSNASFLVDKTKKNYTESTTYSPQNKDI